MPTTKLTPSFIKTAVHCADPVKPGADRTIYWHQKLHGFGLMVTAGGHKSYVVQYRASGVSRRFTIKGSVPLKAALKQAKAVIGQVAKGGDPIRPVERDRRIVQWLAGHGYEADLPSRSAIGRYFGAADASEQIGRNGQCKA